MKKRIYESLNTVSISMSLFGMLVFALERKLMYIRCAPLEASHLFVSDVLLLKRLIYSLIVFCLPGAGIHRFLLGRHSSFRTSFKDFFLGFCGCMFLVLQLPVFGTPGLLTGAIVDC